MGLEMSAFFEVQNHEFINIQKGAGSLEMHFSNSIHKTME